MDVIEKLLFLSLSGKVRNRYKISLACPKQLTFDEWRDKNTTHSEMNFEGPGHIYSLRRLPHSTLPLTEFRPVWPGYEVTSPIFALLKACDH